MIIKEKPDFSFFVPVESDELEKASKKIGSDRYSNMLVQGVASDLSVDTDEEVLEPAGFELGRFLKYGFINYDHRSKDNPKFFIGEPTDAKVENNKFFVKGKLYKDSQTARDLWDTMVMLKGSGSKRKVGWSIEGKALSRHPQNQKRVTKALITNVALTLNPKNSNTYADIVKGNYSNPLPDYVYEDDGNVEKSVQGTSGGKITYLVDVTNPNNGMRYTIDKDLNLKVEKAMSTETARPLIKESLEGGKNKKKAILDVTSAYANGKISKDVLKKSISNYARFEAVRRIYEKSIGIIKDYIQKGKIEPDILEKAKYIKREKKGGKWVYTYAEGKGKSGKKSDKEEGGGSRVSGKPIEYSTAIEMEYNNKYNSKLKKIATGDKITNEDRKKAAEIYGGKVFINPESGVKFTIEVNKNAKKDSDILKVKAEAKDGRAETKNISPANVPFMLG